MNSFYEWLNFLFGNFVPSIARLGRSADVQPRIAPWLDILFCRVGRSALTVSLCRCRIASRPVHVIHARHLRTRPAKLETSSFVSAHALQLRPEAMNKWGMSQKAKARLGKNLGPSQSGPQYALEFSSLSCMGQNFARSVQAVRCTASGVTLASG